ncbi:MAG TPA: DUF1761 domain-containing protein [Hypericibacter adhaerens]|uniref:DUF1761 domain-containing protein n=1 Tax=Hypericibacter adhaerens TaxID=2602016 RepID=UPI002BFF499C|nr:DUF1761 domain-containing protein [Hypericibacter adhaerens]HWA46308.1 DUF1761 domain-containing protein [Hypericibacter adhaerens]
MGRINHFAVLLAVVLQQVVGFVWYHLLFGPAWLAGLGMTPDQMQGRQWRFAVAIGCGLLSAYGLAWLMAATGRRGLGQGLALGLFTGIAFAGSAVLLHYAFIPAIWPAAWIDAGVTVAAALLTGAMLGLWPKRGA